MPRWSASSSSAPATSGERSPSEHDCCLEPVLDLDEALDSELVRAREMVVEVDQPGRRGARAPAGHAREDGPHPRRAHPRPARRSASTPPRCSASSATAADEIAALEESGAVAGPAEAGAQRLVHGMSAATACCRMGELAEASGVSAGTIKHYLREGLLPEPVKTSRNMAWYPPEFVERIRLIKQLQEERFMPLQGDQERARRGPRARAGAGGARGPDPRAGAQRGPRAGSAPPRSGAATTCPREVLDRLAEIGLLSPTAAATHSSTCR